MDQDKIPPTMIDKANDTDNVPRGSDILTPEFKPVPILDDEPKKIVTRPYMFMFFVTFLVGSIATTSSNVSFVDAVGNIIILPLLMLVFFGGVITAKKINEDINKRNSGQQYPKLMNTFIFNLVFNIFVPVIGVLITISGKSDRFSKKVISSKPLDNFIRVILVFSGFLLGALPVLIYGYLLYLFIGLNYCQLTSPKCM